ncbi:cytochrome P450 [Glaciimonas immobilis]|uniref:Cytochrome P450 n=1 Tax=Glaciimonas immobilis TaxID=728004 RepID=A0A840RV38_9BURK|nr:cytochrome P450 [Glaciimonas immobilis]KAF3996142.1 cytochrome P450 [Glaciimonas immobilis]MBB5201705.1 cytochrome P450 [Glaciimonas immobilis]
MSQTATTTVAADAKRSDSVGDDFARVSATFSGNVDNPFPIYRERRANMPVMVGDIVTEFGSVTFTTMQKPRPVYTLFRYHDVMSVLKDAKNFSSGFLMETGMASFMDGFALTAMDGDAHRQARGLLQPCFAPDVLKNWRLNRIQPVIREEFVAPLVSRGKAELVADMALMFPIRVIYDLMGFPNEPESLSKFASAALRILGGISPDPEAKKAAMVAAKELYDSTLKIVQARRAAGLDGDDLISRLIRSSFEGSSLTDHQITMFTRMLLPAAAETTTRTFSTLMTLLLERPELLERIRADRSLISKAIDESVRYEPVATFKVREVQNDSVFQGIAIPKGSLLSLCVASANRDDEVFEDGDTFNIDRTTRMAFGFGFGPHMCVGLFIAKAEIEVALNAMLDMMPDLRFDPDYPRPVIRGIQLRGPEAVHVVWTPQ